MFTFSNGVASGTAGLTSGTGTVSGSPTFTDNTMSVDLTGVTNAQQITVQLSSLTDAVGQMLPNISANMKALAGDVNGDSAVNSGDALLTRNASGQATNGTNLRADINRMGP